jgi:hypothetical protein
MYMQLAFSYSFRQAKVAGEHLDLSSREFPETVESFIIIDHHTGDENNLKPHRASRGS